MPDSSVSVKLHPLKRTDLEAVHRLLSDWKVVRYMLLPHCTSLEESRECLEDLMTENSSGALASVSRKIEDRNSGEVIGLCGIVVLPGSKQGEMWYLVRPDCWRHGVATESARALLRIGFSEMNLHRMFASCLPENPASSRVLEKIGMRREEYQRNNLEIHGVWHDSSLYSILREEWEATLTMQASTMSDKNPKAIPIKNIVSEDGAHELATSPDMQPYLRLIKAGLQDQDTTSHMEEMYPSHEHRQRAAKGAGKPMSHQLGAGRGPAVGQQVIKLPNRALPNAR
ncbi:MAG TPA: GNAT family protein, partial [Bryobacteraceae bacterium]|nr:GNAT family protein [Bryobacteraceae bacterium]